MDEISKIESECGTRSEVPLRYAERLTTKLYINTTRLVLGFQVDEKVNDSAKELVSVHAVKMGGVYVVMQQDLGIIAPGEANIMILC